MNKERTIPILGFLFWILAFLWLIFVCYLSWQNGEQTTELSVGIVERISRWISQLMHRFTFDEIHAWIRKLAHVAVFLILGILSEAGILITANRIGRNSKCATLMVFFACALVSVMTEVVKICIPGRHLHWDEAMLNVISTWIGAGLVLLLTKIFSRHKA